MILIACVDDKLGMMFNSRRQSRDVVLTRKICEIAGGGRLWIKKYSAPLFETEGCEGEKICIDEECLKKAQAGEFCFIEDESPSAYLKDIEKIILFKWNRRYPADLYFDIDLSGFKLEESCEFAGNSHEKITMEVYKR